MDLEIIIVSEVSQTEKGKYHMISTYIWNLDTNQLIYKTNRLMDFENKLIVTEGETWWGGIN